MTQRSIREAVARARELPGTLRKVIALRGYVGKPNQKVREYVARLYLRGEGIEIGALHAPLSLPAETTARYVDRMSLDELQAQYPELDIRAVTPPDIVADGEKLSNLATGSQDFIVANHFVEHCEDPIAAIQNMLRVVRVGGIVFLSIPDKRFTFDAERPATELQHLLDDHALGPGRSRDAHFAEWSLYVEGAGTAEVEKVANELKKRNYSIHYHVWTQTELLELLVALQRDFSLPFDVELFAANDIECIVVLRKTG
jgi:SAM-dependent methyltransferase